MILDIRAYATIKKTTNPDLNIEGEKEQDKEIEPITSDMRRDPSGRLTKSRTGERNCDRVRAHHKRAQPFCGSGPSQMPVDVLSELSGGPQLVGGANLVVFELEEATVRSELERVFRGLAK